MAYLGRQAARSVTEPFSRNMLFSHDNIACNHAGCDHLDAYRISLCYGNYLPRAYTAISHLLPGFVIRGRTLPAYYRCCDMDDFTYMA